MGCAAMYEPIEINDDSPVKTTWNPLMKDD
jgi:hypothetical protein